MCVYVCVCMYIPLHTFNEQPFYYCRKRSRSRNFSRMCVCVCLCVCVCIYTNTHATSSPSTIAAKGRAAETLLSSAKDGRYCLPTEVSPRFYEKSPVFKEKSPVFNEKSPSAAKKGRYCPLTEVRGLVCTTLGSVRCI